MAPPKTLKDLQLAQRNHDISFHRDVFYRSSPDRVRHYCLHFGKYVGRLAKAPSDGEGLNAVLSSTLTDAAIICLALSDVLNVDLDEQLESAFGKPSKAGIEGWAALIDVSGTTMPASQVRDFTMMRGAQATGDLCKVAESLDHIEAFDPRSALLEALVAWLSVILVASTQLRFDLLSGIEARWREVEKKRVT